MNMQALMRQAQNLQRDMLKSKEEIDKMEFTSTSSFVTVKVNGKKEVLSVKITPEEDFDVSDIEILEEMVREQAREAKASSRRLAVTPSPVKDAPVLPVR